jgi:hypothetical protein
LSKGAESIDSHPAVFCIKRMPSSCAGPAGVAFPDAYNRWMAARRLNEPIEPMTLGNMRVTQLAGATGRSGEARAAGEGAGGRFGAAGEHAGAIAVGG